MDRLLLWCACVFGSCGCALWAAGRISLWAAWIGPLDAIVALLTGLLCAVLSRLLHERRAEREEHRNAIRFAESRPGQPATQRPSPRPWPRR